jgi:alkaline phosphatase
MFLFSILFSCFVFFMGCDDNNKDDNDSGSGKAKYVFMFIGDGMSTVQVNSAEVYKASIAAQTDSNYINSSTGLLNMTKSFSSAGFATTYDAGTYCTDSASAGTALSTGYKTMSGVINYDVTKTVKYTTIAEMAKAKGMKVGIVSSVSIDHATPAAYYARKLPATTTTNSSTAC